MDIEKNQVLGLALEDVIGQRIAVLGISGSGKTNTVAVLAEELLPHMPITIVDIEGEYFGLKEKYDLLIAGRPSDDEENTHIEISLHPENAAALAEISIRRGISVILDLSEIDPQEIEGILLPYFESLWKLSTSLKVPYEVIIEEAHEFILQGTRTPLKTLLTRFALRGRKRGVGVILASQRSAKVEKDLLTQANFLFLHSVVHPTDLSVYKDLLPLSGKDVDQQVRELVPGEAFVVRGKQVDRVPIRLRHTYHVGKTPTLSAAPIHLKAIDDTFLKELQELTRVSIKEGGIDELSRARKKLREAEAQIIELQAEIKRQAEQIDLLSRLSVQVNQESSSSSPSVLSIEQATVHSMQFPVTPQQPASPQHVVESTVVPKALGQPAFNDAKFRSFQVRLGKLPALERDILRVLIEQNKALSAEQIAAWLKKSGGHIRNNPPRDLLKLGFVVRSKQGRNYVYSSRLVEYMKQEFPDTNIQHLITQLLH